MPVLNEFLLKNKVAVFAGDGGGSTPILAQALAEAGARVYVAASTKECLDSALAKVKQTGGFALGRVVETTSQPQVRSAMREVENKVGSADILVNNHVNIFSKPFVEIPADQWDVAVEQNARACFLFCREVGKGMLAKGKGRIINIISGLAERGLWNSAAFCASQGAVLQLTRALALEWSQHNIRVNAIGIGWYSNERQPREEAEKELLVRYIPLRRKGHPEDIAGLLVYLASDASDYTTGSAIYVDGGLMTHA
jgi:NAD(P)-dependent dehydrogenase (short-subunit alcohol dehydrogenase family)